MEEMFRPMPMVNKERNNDKMKSKMKCEGR